MPDDGVTVNDTGSRTVSSRTAEDDPDDTFIDRDPVLTPDGTVTVPDITPAPSDDNVSRTVTASQPLPEVSQNSTEKSVEFADHPEPLTFNTSPARVEPL